MVASGDHAVVWSATRFRTIDLRTGAVATPAVDAMSPIFAAATDTKHVDTVGNEGLQQRDPVTGQPIGPPLANVSDVASAPGRLVATTNDGQVLVLDPDTLARVGDPLPGINGYTDKTELSEDGQRLILLGHDHAVHFIDLPSRSFLGDEIDAGSSGGGVALRADRKAFAMATSQGLVVWDTDPAHWSAAACRLAGRDLTTAEWNQYLGAIAAYRATCSAG
jgi:hypothetical protein